MNEMSVQTCDCGLEEVKERIGRDIKHKSEDALTQK